MLPKSVTTPIAMAVSETLGGIVPVTVAAVILTASIFSTLLSTGTPIASESAPSAAASRT